MTLEQFDKLDFLRREIDRLKILKGTDITRLMTALSTDIPIEVYDGVQEIKSEAQERIDRLIDINIDKRLKEFESL